MRWFFGVPKHMFRNSSIMFKKYAISDNLHEILSFIVPKLKKGGPLWSSAVVTEASDRRFR